jgi:predicted dehydrogenase
MSKTTSVSPASKKLRIAFIGAGGIAGAHMSYLTKMNDVEIVALADINEAGMAKHAKTFNVPTDALFTDYKEMLRKIQPDAVSVCTSNGMHAQATIAAHKAGAHVIVEKPLAMNAKEGQAMLDAARKAGKKLVIGFQYRFGSNAQYLKSAIDAGQFGKILYVRSQALRRRGIPNWGVFGRKELQGGGPLIDIGVHILEVSHYVMGSPKPVSAVGNTWTYHGNKPSTVKSEWPNWDHKTYTVEDLAVGMIRFENGAMLTLESSFVSHIEKGIWNFNIMGEKAGASWDPAGIFRDDNDYMSNQVPGFLPNVDNFEAKMRNFVDHVLYNKPTLAPAEHGLMVQKMLDAIYKSAETGKEVKIS